MPVGPNTFIEYQSLDVVHDEGAKFLAYFLVRISDKQASMLFAAYAVTHKTNYLARGIDARFPKAAYKPADRRRLSTLELISELSSARN